MRHFAFYTPKARDNAVLYIDFCKRHALRDMGAAESWAERNMAYRFGVLFRKGSLWVGVHYSEGNKRWCINLIPCVTLWITKPGGNTP